MVVTPEITAKLESLSSDDYNMVVMSINRLADKPSNVLKSAREKYLRNNSMTIDDEIESSRIEVTSSNIPMKDEIVTAMQELT